MNFIKYKSQIDSWSEKIANENIVLSNGKKVPITFWKSFLGLTRKQHQEMYRGKYKNKSGTVPKYIAQSINFANLLELDIFLQQVKSAILVFEKDKSS